MARTYKRDANGRFAGGGGGSSGGGAKAGKGGKGKGSGGSKGGGKPKASPKTTSARGRALVNERRAKASLKKTDKAGIADRKTAKSMLVAQRAREYYRRSQTGTKRSPSKASGGKAAKPAASVMTSTKKRGRPAGPSGGKAGTRSQQQRAAKEQAARNKQFSSKSKSESKGWISARDAYKTMASRLRYERVLRREYGGGPRQVKAAQRALTTMRRTRQAPAAIVDRVRPAIRKRKRK